MHARSIFCPPCCICKHFVRVQCLRHSPYRKRSKLRHAVWHTCRAPGAIASDVICFADTGLLSPLYTLSCLVCSKNRVHKRGMWFFFFSFEVHYSYINGSRYFSQGWVTLFLYDSLLWIKCIMLSSQPAAHRRFPFKALWYRTIWKSLELQPAGRAQRGAACSRLFATNYYTWTSKSSLIPFFFSSSKPVLSLSKPIEDFAAHLFWFWSIGLLPAFSPLRSFSLASNSVYAQVWRKMQKNSYKLFSPSS